MWSFLFLVGCFFVSIKITSIHAAKHNYCAALGQMLNASNLKITPSTALKGQTIDIGVNLDGDPSMMYFAPNAKVPSGGFLYTIQQEVARRGGFTINYVLVDNFYPFVDTESYLLAILPKVDLYGGAAITDTAYRRDLTFDFTTQVIDNSMLMISTSTRFSTNSYWYFAKPFQPLLWLLLISVCIFNGFLFYFTERFRSIDKESEVLKGMVVWEPRITLIKAISESLYVSGEPEPTTFASGIVKLSFAFFIFLSIASYTANLANILIKNQTPVIAQVSIADADFQSAIVCALDGPNPNFCQDCSGVSATTFGYVNATYPAIQLYPVNSNDPVDLLKMINNQTCTSAVLTITQWDSVSNYADANANCNIVPQPAFPNSIFSSYVGAFPCQLDYTSLCTSAVQVVFSTILIQMHEDNSIVSLYDSYIQNSRTTVNCTAVQEAAASIAIDIKDIRGIYVIFALMIFASLIPMLTTISVRSLKKPERETREINFQEVEFPKTKLRVMEESEERSSRSVRKSETISNPTTTDYDASNFIVKSRDSILAVSASLINLGNETSSTTMSSISNTFGSGFLQPPDLGVRDSLNNMDLDLGLSSLGNRLGSGIFQTSDLSSSGKYKRVSEVSVSDSIIVTPTFDVDLGLSSLGNTLGSGIFQTIPFQAATDLDNSTPFIPPATPVFPTVIPPAAPVFPASPVSSPRNLPVSRRASSKTTKPKIFMSNEQELSL